MDIYLLEYLFKACTSKLFSKRQRGSQILLLPRGVKRNFFLRSLRSLSPVDPILNSPAPPPGLTCSVLPPSPLRTSSAFVQRWRLDGHLSAMMSDGAERAREVLDRKARERKDSFLAMEREG